MVFKTQAELWCRLVHIRLPHVSHKPIRMQTAYFGLLRQALTLSSHKRIYSLFLYLQIIHDLAEVMLFHQQSIV